MRISARIRMQLRTSERQIRPCAADLDSPVDRVARLAKRRSDSARWVDVLRADPCSWCGMRGGTIDHVTPRSKGAPREHIVQNSAAACHECNCDRGNLSVLEYLIRRLHGAPPSRRRGRRFRREESPNTTARLAGAHVTARNAAAIDFLVTKILRRSR